MPKDRRTLIGEEMVAQIRVLSLGAGVQSTALALMAAHGDVQPTPDAAIFADTGDEPAAVYDHLAWLMSGNVLPFPICVVRSYKSLSDALRSGDEGARIPFHVGKGGIGMRQCTRNWKLRPIRRETRRLLGKGPRDYIAPGTVEAWIGISTDEIFRIKPSTVQFISNRHPLIELRMSRQDCERWLQVHNYPVPQKSSCVFCPYKSNSQWAEMKARDPASWADAIAMDNWLREPTQLRRFHGSLFVHRSRVALAEAQLDPHSAQARKDLFDSECEGICGV